MGILPILIFVNIVGIANAAYLYWQYSQYKSYERKMVCILGARCEEVVDSSYGITLGVKNELLGIFYYLSIIFLLILFYFYPSWSMIRLFLCIAGSCSVVFSSNLLYIQLFKLRNICSWCLLSALINYLIFVLLFFI